MPRIARTLSMAFALFGGVVASQGPEFAQQYRQRLGGAIDELRRVVTRFDADAQATGQSRDAAIARLREDKETLVQRQGDAMRANAERLVRLEQYRMDYVSAGPFRRLGLLTRDADSDLVRQTYADFEPALPVTEEGLLSALAGFIGAWGVARLIGGLFRRLSFRRRRLAMGSRA